MPRVRDFKPEALQAFFSPKLQVGTPFEGPVWQFIIFIPRWLLASTDRISIFSAKDEATLEDQLQTHFGGCTIAPYHRGIGRRGRSVEQNSHRVISVLASRWRGTWRYFKALRSELEACTGEEQILILHQPLWIV